MITVAAAHAAAAAPGSADGSATATAAAGDGGGGEKLPEKTDLVLWLTLHPTQLRAYQVRTL